MSTKFFVAREEALSDEIRINTVLFIEIDEHNTLFFYLDSDSHYDHTNPSSLLIQGKYETYKEIWNQGPPHNLFVEFK